VSPVSRDIRRREIGGPDPLDRRLEPSRRPSPFVWLLSLLRTRSALGFAPSLTPAVIFLPVGALLGPAALGVLSPLVVERLEVVVTVALAVLGVVVGMELAREVTRAWLLFVAASLESLVTIIAVAGATAYFIVATGVPVQAPVLVFALVVGVCASASSATSADPDTEPAAGIATRIADLDDVLPIAVAVLAFALLPGPEGRSPTLLMAAPVAIGLVIGAIGWLLFERAESGPERVIFVIGALALAGGAAAYLNVSPLAVGLVAGFTWTIAPGRADRIVADDLRRVQHPLVVMLLLTAGALTTVSPAAVWLLTPYLLFRLAGKVAGAWISARFVDVHAGDLASYLMSPGVLAVAFALNFRQVLPGASGEMLVSTVALGTAAFELFALAVVPHWRPGGRR
jgi:hypothetical protein